MEMEVPPITPYLVVSNAAAAVEFYKKAFGATVDGEAHIMPGTDKIMHVRLVINGGLIMLADDFSTMRNSKSETPEALCGSPITLALSLTDVQSFWDRAVAGGATATMPLADMFWGERYGQVVDPYGHKWSMGQLLHAMTDEQMQEAADTAMAKRGTLMGEAAEN